MRLIAVYILFVTIGEGFSYGAGRIAERFSDSAGFMVFMTCFFAVFWAAWKLAVRMT